MNIEKQESGPAAFDLEGDVGTEALDAGRRSSRWPRYLEADLGLRNYWYPAFFSNELAEGETRAEEICGERILFKRVRGQVYAVEDRCIHRGVAFSAKPECFTENTLTCWFHGFTFDVRDGKLVQIITEPGSSLIGKVGLPTYHVHEEFMFVWVFIGDEDKLVPVDWDLPPHYVEMRRKTQEEGARYAFHPLSRAKLEGNWRDASENGNDTSHVYGHRDADLIVQGLTLQPLAFYARNRKGLHVFNEPGHPIGIRPLEGEEIDDIWEAEIEGVKVKSFIPKELPNFDAASEFRQNLRRSRKSVGATMNLPCFLSLGGGDNAQWPFPGHHEWYVPVDEDHHMYTIMWCKRVENDQEERDFHEQASSYWAPLVWNNDNPNIIGFTNFDAYNRSESYHAYANENWHERERLYKPDMAITLWRRLVDKYARVIQTRGNFAKRIDPAPPVVCYRDEPGKMSGSRQFDAK